MAGVLLQDRILAVEHEAGHRSAAVREVDHRDLGDVLAALDGFECFGEVEVFLFAQVVPIAQHGNGPAGARERRHG
jgi:hypothetical protein